MNTKNLIISIIFVIFGISAILFALNRPCEIGEITQTIGNVTSKVEQPAEMNRMVCLSTDAIALISILLGTASVFPGLSGFYKSLTDSK